VLKKTVAELESGMSAREFAEWFEYYKIEPFGDDWLQASTIAAAQVGVWSKQKIKADAFIPRAKQRDDKAAIIAKLNRFAQMHNDKEARKGQRT
jgi:hypothetical protein